MTFHLFLAALILVGPFLTVLPIAVLVQLTGGPRFFPVPSFRFPSLRFGFRLVIA